MTTFTSWLTIINLCMIVVVPFAGYLAFRSSLSKAKDEIQERVQRALETENKLLHDQLDRQDKSMKRMDKILQLIATTLKRTHNIELSIDEDIVILRDIKSGSQHSARISGSLDTGGAKVKPIRLQPIPAEDDTA